MNNIVDRYLAGLHERLGDEDRKDLSHAQGADPKQLAKLKKKFPECPDSLLKLLERINGTYWQKYGEHTISVLMLGSDVEEYPYYLKSVEQILKGKARAQSIRTIYDEDFDEMGDDFIEGPIDPDLTMDHWLCFSDCMNNGGTSQLYLDFNPLPGGVSGQVVRFLHDPDSYKVIANSFDEYLEMLMKKEYDFIHDEEDEEI